MVVCVNGRFVAQDEAVISVFDHGLLYGDGVFDTIAAVDGTVYWLDEHLDRLLDGCATLRITVPWTRASLVDWTHGLIERNHTPTARLRLTITRGCGEVPIYASRACRPNLVMIGTPLDLPDPRVYEQGVRLKTTELARVCPHVKSLNFLPSVLAYFDAHEAGADDALFVSPDRRVREGATFNVAAIRGRTVVTPAAEMLMGVTRAKVIDLARASGYTVDEQPLPLEDLFAADEAFLTGTTKRVIPICGVDGRAIGDGRPGPVTRDLLARFRRQYF
jgi:branched-chain amino acid aminotransferase